MSSMDRGDSGSPSTDGADISLLPEVLQKLDATLLSDEAKARMATVAARMQKLEAVIEAFARGAASTEITDEQAAQLVDISNQLQIETASIDAARSATLRAIVPPHLQQGTTEATYLAGLVRAMVRLFGANEVEEAVKREIRRGRRRGPDAFETFVRQCRADELQRADPALTRWAAVMQVCEEEGIKRPAQRRRIFDKIYQRDAQRSRRCDPFKDMTTRGEDARVKDLARRLFDLLNKIGGQPADS
jgi:hypothetical protein